MTWLPALLGTHVYNIGVCGCDVLRATELFLLGGFAVPSSDKIVTLHHFAANWQVPKGAPIWSYLSHHSRVSRSLCFTHFRKYFPSFPFQY